MGFRGRKGSVKGLCVWDFKHLRTRQRHAPLIEYDPLAVLPSSIRVRRGA